ncbi:MAG: carboxypeptidase regulatory-like domain-containing protein, partial [Candidatus Binatia bacterium]
MPLSVVLSMFVGQARPLLGEDLPAPTPAPVKAPAPGKPADAATGRTTIEGTVVDATSAYPVVGATVQVDVVGQKMRAETDLDGRFTLKVPPGTYKLRISADLYRTKVVTDVQVAAGKPTALTVTLPPNVAGNVQVVVVVGAASAANEASELLKRQSASTVGDSISAEAIATAPDSSAAEVVTRLPAVTIKDNKFIIVRGLGERYSSALLNGSRLPSTDPNRRIIPLDLFPGDFIGSLNVVKTYTPDLPGDFAGGLVDLRLADPPSELTYGLSTSLGFNTETTFQEYDTYDGYAADWVTFGNVPRDLPDTVKQIFPGETSMPTTTQMQTAVGSLPLNWNTFGATAPPNFSVNGYVGSSYGPVGFNLAATYGWKFQVHRQEVLNSFTSDSQVEDGSGE